MTNPYYNPTGNPGTGTAGLSASMRAEFALIAAGFALLPTFSGGSAGQAIVVNSSGTAFAPTALFTMQTNGSWLSTIQSATPITLASSIYEATGSVNNYLSFDIRNAYTGNNASSDFVATADTGTDTTNYINFGINSSTYAQGTWTINGALDGYLFTQSSNLSIGTAAAKYLSFFTGGTLAANEVARFTAGGNFLIGTTTDNGQDVQVKGTSGSTGVLAAGTAAYPLSFVFASTDSGITSIALGNSTTTSVNIGTALSTPFTISTNNLARIYVYGGGNVGIGSPYSDNGARLQITAPYTVPSQTWSATGAGGSVTASFDSSGNFTLSQSYATGFNIATNGTNALLISSTQQVTTPQQVSFYAHRTTAQTSGNGILFSTIVTNVGGGLSNAGAYTVFTAPVTGTYHLDACVTFYNASGGTIVAGFGLYHSVLGYLAQWTNTALGSTVSGGGCASTTIAMTAGQTVNVFVYSGPLSATYQATDAPSSTISFSGYLLG